MYRCVFSYAILRFDFAGRQIGGHLDESNIDCLVDLAQYVCIAMVCLNWSVFSSNKNITQWEIEECDLGPYGATKFLQVCAHIGVINRNSEYC